MTALLVAACSVLGLVVGWMLDPVITRVPRKRALLGPPAPDEPPSPRGRRVTVAIANAVLFGAMAARFDDSWTLVAYLVLTAALLALSVIARAADEPVDFARDVQPIFERRCYQCHAESKQESGLRLDVKAAALQGGDNYGPDNLHQLDLKFSRRFKVDRYRIRADVDVYNVFNSNWPFTRTNTFSTATSSAWLRPTNVLQARFVKLGAQFEF